MLFLEALWCASATHVATHRSSDNPDCSWRVGVNLPPDEAALAELRELAALGALGPEELLLASQLTGARTVPAVMKLRLVRRRPPAQVQPPREQQPPRRRALRGPDTGLPPRGAVDVYGYSNANSDGSGGAALYISDSDAAAATMAVAAAAPINPQLGKAEGLSAATAEAPWRVGPGQRASGGYGSGYSAEYLHCGVNLNGLPRLQGQGQAPGRSAGGDVRLVLPTPRKGQTVYEHSGVGGVGGSTGFQLPSGLSELQEPAVLLDAVGVGGGEMTDSSRRPDYHASSLGQQGAGAPAAKSSMANQGQAAVALAAAAADTAGMGRMKGGATGTGNGRWPHGVVAKGPVAEAVEQAGGAQEVAASDDKAVLEQLGE